VPARRGLGCPAGAMSLSTFRCATHPGRPAVDRCPVCGRPRCGACATGPGCRICTPADGGEGDSRPARTGPRPPDPLERGVRGALAATAAALAGGVVASEYVGAPVFALLAPLVLGVLCGAAATRAASTDGRRRLGRTVRALAALYAVLGTGFGFLLEGSARPLSTSSDVLLAYAAALVGAVAWTLPPRRPRRPRPTG